MAKRISFEEAKRISFEEAKSATPRKECKEEIKCSICLNTYKKPKCLPCLHTFCLECLQQFGKDNIPGAEMNCPMCRKAFTIPAGGFEEFPTNFYIGQLLELAGLKLDDKSEMCSCEMCKNVSPQEDIFYCIECKQKCCKTSVL